MAMPNPYTVLRGAMIRPVGDKTIQIWRTAHCTGCGCQGSVGLSSRYCPDIHEALRAGLRFTNSEPPAPLYHLHHGSGEYCGTCRMAWVEGRGSIREPRAGAPRG